MHLPRSVAAPREAGETGGHLHNREGVIDAHSDNPFE
jgi:hypothetical protein